MKRPIWERARSIPGDRQSFLGDAFQMDDTWKRVEEFHAPPESDGRTAVVWVHRMPAQFWRVTVGDVEFTTGSGNEMGELAERIAQAFAQGMLGCSLIRKDHSE